MTWQTEIQHIFLSKSFKKRIWQGAGIALLLVCIVLLIISKGNIGPLMLVPMAYVTVGGVAGGAFFSLMDLFRSQGTWQKILANVIGILAYVVILYAFLILGLSVIGRWD